jgi:hypothetical protein
MADQGGDTNKIVIELEIQVKDLTKQLGEVQKQLNGFESKQRGPRSRKKKEDKANLEGTKALTAANAKLGKSYDVATKSVPRMQKAWGFI